MRTGICAKDTGKIGYRYLHPGAGHACLSAGCGVCAIEAFSDDDMDDLLELDGVERGIPGTTIALTSYDVKKIKPIDHIWSIGLKSHIHFHSQSY